MKQFDAALKHSIGSHPGDWARFLGVPEGLTVEAVDAELSVVTQASDKLLRVGTEPATLVHIEFHGWSDGEFDPRMLLYHATIVRREKLPVHSVAFILIPEAWRADNRGGVRHTSVFPGCRIDFAYQVIKVWELPVESILSAGLGVLPLAPLTNVTEQQLPGVIETLAERLEHETARPDAAELWAATHILMGLKYSEALVEVMLEKVSVDHAPVVDVSGHPAGRGVPRSRGGEERNPAAARTARVRRSIGRHAATACRDP